MASAKTCFVIGARRHLGVWHLAFDIWYLGRELTLFARCHLSRHSLTGRFVSFVTLSGLVVAWSSPASLTHALADNTCQPAASNIIPVPSQSLASGLLSTSTSACHLSRPMPAATTCTSSLMLMLMLL
jgi:hypothetical protein